MHIYPWVLLQGTTDVVNVDHYDRSIIGQVGHLSTTINFTFSNRFDEPSKGSLWRQPCFINVPQIWSLPSPIDCSPEHLSIARNVNDGFRWTYHSHVGGVLDSMTMPLTHEHATIWGDSWPQLLWNEVEAHIHRKVHVHTYIALLWWSNTSFSSFFMCSAIDTGGHSSWTLIYSWCRVRIWVDGMTARTPNPCKSPLLWFPSTFWSEKHVPA